MINTKTFALLVFMALSMVPVLSQPTTGKISGTIIDKATQLPIEAADVTLLSGKDSSVIKGAATDKDGNFEFAGIPFGQYTVRANLVGYSFAIVRGITLSAEKPDAVLDPIRLSAGTTTTEEILVESEKSAVQFQADKKIFNVGQNPINQSGS